eukprot:TRINITY_DN23947_c0_g1_i1.p1 TRINITY_DN23947_c0_g1~~TRINITY_DN23947_c0_g1_i1.p1  ORF type:complete len:182 (-),score=47.68 TRINITY_DN23947_c0_g1_i1:12-557(-)
MDTHFEEDAFIEKQQWHKKAKKLAEKRLVGYIATMEPGALQENCLVTGVQSAVMGGGLGFLMGAFFSSIGDTSHIQNYYGPDGKLLDKPKIPIWKQVGDGFKAAAKSGVFMGRGFAMFGGVFSVINCMIEKKRARSDLYNSLYAGCITGGLLAAGGGPGTMALSCAGIGAFSVGMDYLLGH